MQCETPWNEDREEWNKRWKLKHFTIEGMTCASCAQTVEKRPRVISGGVKSLM